MTFTYHGTPHEVYDHPYNATALNERGVELAVAKAWMADLGAGGLEVGNVTSHYWPSGHHVVDLYERGEGVSNVDVFAATGPRNWVLSISTLEHVYWDTRPRDPDGAAAALVHLRDAVRAPGAPMLLTVPLGYHAPLDAWLMAGGDEADRACTIVRSGSGWRQTKHLTHKPYGATTPWAEAVWIGEWVT